MQKLHLLALLAVVASVDICVASNQPPKKPLPPPPQDKAPQLPPNLQNRPMPTPPQPLSPVNQLPPFPPAPNPGNTQSPVLGAGIRVAPAPHPPQSHPDHSIPPSTLPAPFNNDNKHVPDNSAFKRNANRAGGLFGKSDLEAKMLKFAEEGNVNTHSPNFQSPPIINDGGNRNNQFMQPSLLQDVPQGYDNVKLDSRGKARIAGPHSGRGKLSDVFGDQTQERPNVGIGQPNSNKPQAVGDKVSPSRAPNGPEVLNPPNFDPKGTLYHKQREIALPTPPGKNGNAPQIRMSPVSKDIIIDQELPPNNNLHLGANLVQKDAKDRRRSKDDMDLPSVSPRSPRGNRVINLEDGNNQAPHLVKSASEGDVRSHEADILIGYVGFCTTDGGNFPLAVRNSLQAQGLFVVRTVFDAIGRAKVDCQVDSDVASEQRSSPNAKSSKQSSPGGFLKLSNPFRNRNNINARLPAYDPQIPPADETERKKWAPRVCRVMIHHSVFRNSLKVYGMGSVPFESYEDAWVKTGEEAIPPILISDEKGSRMFVPSLLHRALVWSCGQPEPMRKNYGENDAPDWSQPDIQEHYNIWPADYAVRPRLVVIGDLHGDYDQATRVLKASRIRNDKGDLMATNTKVIQLGDLIDRGPRSKAVVELFLDLRKRQQVEMLLGNHEVFALAEDNFMANKYAYHDAIVEFSPPETSEEVKQELLHNQNDPRRKQAIANRIRAYGQKGVIGKHLIRNPIVYVHHGEGNDPSFVFSHGDLLPEFSQRAADGSLNERVPLEISIWKQNGGKSSMNEDKRLDSLPMGIGDDGPTQARGFSDEFRSRNGISMDPAERCAKVQDSLNALNVNAIFVGHTNSFDLNMRVTCDDKQFIIDLSMSRFQPVPSDGNDDFGDPGRHTLKRPVGFAEIRGDRVRLIYDLPGDMDAPPYALVKEYVVPRALPRNDVNAQGAH